MLELMSESATVVPRLTRILSMHVGVVDVTGRILEVGEDFGYEN